MLAALGMFVFETDSLLFDSLTRDRDWRHGDSERHGARAASQYLGPGEDKVSLGGLLVREIAGSYSSIETLVEMADSGDAYPLADGSGRILGSFTIRSLREQHDALIDTGEARVIGFSLDLKRVD